MAGPSRRPCPRPTRTRCVRWRECCTRERVNETMFAISRVEHARFPTCSVHPELTVPQPLSLQTHHSTAPHSLSTHAKHAAILSTLAAKARSVVRQLDERHSLNFMSLKTTGGEIMVALDPHDQVGWSGTKTLSPHLSSPPSYPRLRLARSVHPCGTPVAQIKAARLRSLSHEMTR